MLAAGRACSATPSGSVAVRVSELSGTARSLRRAVELGDGWAPFRLTLDEIAACLARARDTKAWNARTSPLDVIVPTDPLDPIDEPDATAETIARYAEAGATMCNVRVVHHSREHYKEQLQALRTAV